jgi:hypothetical protein
MAPCKVRKNTPGDRHSNDSVRCKAARHKKIELAKIMKMELIQLKEENDKLNKENIQLKLRMKD